MNSNKKAEIGKMVFPDKVCWYRNLAFHREDGPAIESHDGTKIWFVDGKRHRENGPAIELADGGKEWWLNDVQLTEEEFNQWLMKKSLNDKLHSTLVPRPKTKRGKI
jgi:hypothetical protein